jgi:hypothetical protein
MEKIIIIKQSMDELLALFPKVVEEDKQMELKRLNGWKFDLKSTDAFSKNLQMPEHQHYFVSGEFIRYRYETHIRYTVRANSLFQLLAWVVPLFALPTLLIGLMAFKSNPGKNLNILLLNCAIYAALVGVSTFVYFSQNKKLIAKGEQKFKKLMKQLEKKALPLYKNDSKLNLED